MKILKIENRELIVLLEINNNKYGNIKVCKSKDLKEDVLLIDNKIIDNEENAKEIKTNLGLELPDELKNITI